MTTDPTPPTPEQANLADLIDENTRLHRDIIQWRAQCDVLDATITAKSVEREELLRRVSLLAVDRHQALRDRGVAALRARELRDGAPDVAAQQEQIARSEEQYDRLRRAYDADMHRHNAEWAEHRAAVTRLERELAHERTCHADAAARLDELRNARPAATAQELQRDRMALGLACEQLEIRTADLAEARALNAAISGAHEQIVERNQRLGQALLDAEYCMRRWSAQLGRQRHECDNQKWINEDLAAIRAVLQEAGVRRAPGFVVPVGEPQVSKLASYFGATVMDSGLVGRVPAPVTPPHRDPSRHDSGAGWSSDGGASDVGMAGPHARVLPPRGGTVGVAPGTPSAFHPDGTFGATPDQPVMRTRIRPGGFDVPAVMDADLGADAKEAAAAEYYAKARANADAMYRRPQPSGHCAHGYEPTSCPAMPGICTVGAEARTAAETPTPSGPGGSQPPEGRRAMSAPAMPGHCTVGEDPAPSSVRHDMTGNMLDPRPCRLCGTDGPCDCVARVNCPEAGQTLHKGCGICKHSRPVFACELEPDLCFRAGGRPVLDGEEVIIPVPTDPVSTRKPQP